MRSKMSCQAQSCWSLTSHFPSWEPPQGPLSSDLEQRAMGQMPPVRPRMQSPQAAQVVHQPKISCTLPMPRIRASTSSKSL